MDNEAGFNRETGGIDGLGADHESAPGKGINVGLGHGQGVGGLPVRIGVQQRPPRAERPGLGEEIHRGVGYPLANIVLDQRQETQDTSARRHHARCNL